MRLWLIFGVAAVTSWLGPVLATAADWPQFRGPRGDGTAEGRNLPTKWGGGFGELAWQAEIPGRGWSSPVVVGDRVWLTTAESLALPTADRQRKLEQGLYKDFQEQFQAHSSVTLYAIEIDVKSGVHHFVRVIRGRIFYHRDLVAKLSGITNS